MPKKLVLLDGYSIMYRAFHALQTPMTAPDGTPTNAVHGFTMVLLKVIADEKPDYLAVAFDVSKHTFRNDMYSAYKANRKPMPEELRVQDPIIRALVGQMDIPILELEGYEADDILGTVSMYCEDKGIDALLVTGDRDSFQLAGERTSILYTNRSMADVSKITPEWIMDKYGVPPEKLIDVKGLMGDSSDNIPGVPGVGEKTALKLIQEFGSLEAVLDTADEKQKGKLRERLIENAELARLSKRLAAIDRHAPVDIELQALSVGDLSGALPKLSELNMRSAAERLRAISGKRAPAPAPASVREYEELTRERVLKLANTAKWASITLGDELALITDAAALKLDMSGDLISSGLAADEAMELIMPVLTSGCDKYLHDMKALPVDLRLINGNVFDSRLAAYALNPQRPSFALSALLSGAGLPDDALHELCVKQERELMENELYTVYSDIELPLTYVLRDMEREGFLVDENALVTLGERYRERITELTGEILDMAGVSVNLNSPKQLSELLFTRMKIPMPAGKLSTNAETLEALADEYPICGKILEYRKYQKLNSTYIVALLRLRGIDGRIRTSFDQVATATGRISSLEPNLQNIPVRTELGREIRGAFIARPGWLLVDADYSQIELRVLAHMSGDENMRRAFIEGDDIHKSTAAEVFGVPPDLVTGEMRSAAKAVNFGIVYGISDFSLAKNTGVSRQEAKRFIERYFQRYPGVKRFMDESVLEGKRLGYVCTLFKRRRYLPELKSPNYNVRSFGERCAMNSPIQGTAADIIKLAMIHAHKRLISEGLQARLILQVHDELIIEAPEAEVERVKALLIDCMENVTKLSVPLKVDISAGGNWRECK